MRASLLSVGPQKPSCKITASAYLWLLWEETGSKIFTSLGKKKVPLCRRVTAFAFSDKTIKTVHLLR